MSTPANNAALQQPARNQTAQLHSDLPLPSHQGGNKAVPPATGTAAPFPLYSRSLIQAALSAAPTSVQVLDAVSAANRAISESWREQEERSRSDGAGV